MVVHLEWRTQILRVQIADQRNSPMPERQAAIEQRERGMRIMQLARKLRQSGSLNTRRRHGRFRA
jgi:hypothetical protein